MVERLKLVNKVDAILLHPNASDILFENRRFVKNIFLQIKGHCEIVYFGISIINPSNELIAFSSMPHLEYNLIQQGLWKHDLNFCSTKLNSNTLFWWDDPDINGIFAEQIKELKLTRNHFSSGMTISRENQGFYFLYSYATNINKKNLKEYYNTKIFRLIDMGDYFYNSLRPLYLGYCINKFLPPLSQLTSKIPQVQDKPKIKLIVNNL